MHRLVAKKVRRVLWRGSLSLSQKRGGEKLQQSLRTAAELRFVSVLGANATLHDWAWVARFRDKRDLLQEFNLGSLSLDPAKGILGRLFGT